MKPRLIRLIREAIIPDFFSMRTLGLFLVYSAIIFISLLFAFLLRFDFSFEVLDKFEFIDAFVMVVVVKMFFLVFFGQFRGLISFFHIPDMIKIFWAMTFTLVLLVCANFAFYKFGYQPIPRGVIVSDYIISMISLCAFRMFMRIYRERNMCDPNRSAIKTERIAIIGAGDLGTSLASDLMSHKSLGIRPVIFMDEDVQKQGKQIMGLEVLPLDSNLASIVRGYKISKVVIASTRFPGKKIAKIITEFKKLGVNSNIVPSYYDIASGRARVSNIREVAIEDVLGRDPVKLDSEAIDNMLKGKVVMVTGAGGSIGRELCRQIASKAPSLLIMIDHCEVQLFQVEQEILRGEYGIPIRPLVGSVVDERRMEHIVSHFHPDIIFHAAAHKHVPMMESQPSEALKNNTLGTWVLANVASRNNVGKFLLISTDKAINPANVMGATKRLAEKSVQAVQKRPGNATQFVAVRFGNVLGSSGSVIPTFKRQISEGGPVTVTHPDVTRYFMTIPEAVGLVLQCGSQAFGGEIFVLDMGEPIKIIDLARQLIRLSGLEPDVDIQIKIIGLRPGEKLYEELQHKNESLVETPHPRIYGFVSEPPTYDEMKKIADEIRQNADSKSVNDLKMFIFEHVPEYKAQFYD